MRFSIRFFLFVTFLFCFEIVHSQVGGIITNEQGMPLPFASIIVKGTSKGTTSNNEGRYQLTLSPGNYTLECQHIGYQKQEKNITIAQEAIALNFSLRVQQYILKEVFIRQKEDPAYEIIRNAIKAKKEYVDEVESFTCEVYSKGVLKLRNSPKKFLGQIVDFEDGDTGSRRMLYLSESIARYSFQKPNKRKIEVISTKVSGQSNSYGLSTPVNLNFYKNNIIIGSNLNPRGYVSPVADGALNFYRYKYMGGFVEDGVLICRIKVIPKRTYEPLFSGYINIIDSTWRIQSVQLELTRQSQMQFLDTLRIEQLYVNSGKAWTIKTQVFYPAVKFFGFDAHGSFLNMYSDYNLDPQFNKNHFGNTFLKYDSGSNKKDSVYWSVARPVPLQQEEVRDYRKKDSLEIQKQDPLYLDSLDRKNNKLSLSGILLTGQEFNRRSKRVTYGFSPLLQLLSYNTVEGLVMNLTGSYTKKLVENGRKSISLNALVRYGFGNNHLNGHVNANYTFGTRYFNQFGIGFGKRVFQFNNNNPISPAVNTWYTLLEERNFLKLYEAWWLRLRYTKSIGDGFSMTASLQYQDRRSLENTSFAQWKNYANREFTPNYPVELTPVPMPNHKAVTALFSLSFQPGMRYIEFPETKIAIGSKYPRFTISYVKGVANVLGSEVDYDKWNLQVSDKLNFRLAGRLDYRFGTGGFLNRNKVFIPDYIHFNGNQTAFAGDYLNTFQLASYYGNSNTASWYGIAHAEHHFNGFLTNKIPFFKKLNWFLVGGANTFYVNKDQYYAEVFCGMENVLKIMRVDFIWGYTANISKPVYGVRLGFTRFLNNQGRAD